ncbi:twin-arginine translocase TatA/TatE family subunit [Qipengyuania sediminis]|uniref:twin-arginine translocase TatA/TatE family subunit n=1 Tax=Qipengyuania sediminis TaxID=1532023 RepID=UPI00105A0707|nr:twin-arginine translocase TatA/TatE family subunit [Qipengyuania sediminis]
MGSFSLWHWLVVLVIVLVLFGRGRVADIMGEFGKGLKSFKHGMKDEDAEYTRRIEGPAQDAKPAGETSRDPQPAERADRPL